MEIAWHALAKGVITILPVLAIIGIFRRRRDAATPLLAGASIATWFGAIVDPNRFDMIRCVVLPVTPALAAFAGAALFDGTTVVSRLLGPAAQSLRYVFPGCAGFRKDTEKER